MATPFSHKPPLITILSDHPAQDRNGESGISKAEHLADKDLLALESRLSPVFDILRHKNTRSPLTIAIYGTWGTGKTSAMRWLETRLLEWNSPNNKHRNHHPKVHPIWFDPWRYHSKEDVWRGIISEVILALFTVGKADPQTLFPRLMQAAKQFGGFLGRGFLHALAAVEAEVEPEILGTKLGKIKFKGEAVRTIWEEYEKTNHPEKAYLNQFEDTLREWISEFLPKKEDGTDTERIAIFIDDLDRCLPDVTLEVLEALKLYLNIPSLIFVVGLDREVVDAVVSNHYKQNGIPEEKARSYLDKIFQVDLTIPPSQRQMGGYLDAQIGALNAATGDHWNDRLLKCSQKTRVHDAIAALAKHNPREIKRLLNSALIRGRNAELDKTLDAQLGMDAKKRAERFASGVQVFLLQRLTRNLLLGADNLLITEDHANWFEKASMLARAVADATGSEIRDGKALLETLADVRNRQGKQKTAMELINEASEQRKTVNAEMATLDRHLRSGTPTRDNGSAIDTQFWENPLLWDILFIPFHAAIAQSAPRLEDPLKSQPPHAVDLAACSPDFIERLARSGDVAPNVLVPAHLGMLRELDLEGVSATTADLRVLSSLSQLRWLDMSLTSVSDLSFLSGLSQLLTINLTATRVSDLSALSGLSHLQTLWLGGTPVSDLSPLQGLSHIRELDLSGTLVSDLRPLSKLSQLVKLNLNFSRVSTLSALVGLSQLRELFLQGTEVNASERDNLTQPGLIIVKNL